MSEEQLTDQPVDELEQLKAELEKTKQEAEDNLAGWQRAKADYLNVKKGEEKKYQEMAEFINAAFMAEIIPIYNNYKLAMNHVPEEAKKESWVVGLEFIQKMFSDFLAKYGISEIKTVGEQFNPEVHEALTHEEREGFKEDEIFEEVAPGYMLKDRVINPAKVKVAK